MQVNGRLEVHCGLVDARERLPAVRCCGYQKVEVRVFSVRKRSPAEPWFEQGIDSPPELGT